METAFQSHLLLSVFGAPKLTMEYFGQFNEQTRILYWMIPILIACALLEFVAQWRERSKDNFHPVDALNNFLTGVGYLVSTSLTRTLMFAFLIAIYNFIPWRQELNWWMFIPCFILHDFTSYWKHRISHHSRLWWSIHVPHHSSNHYNLWINFRQSWFEQVTTVFFIPLLLLGFHPVLYVIIHAVNPLFQFWVHTEYIGKLPRWIEYVFVTPSAHQVHHSSNEKYLDKNFGNTILLWDRMFGTYQPLDERPVFGLTTPLQTNNVFYIVFHEAADMFRDIKNAPSLREKLWMLFGSPAKIARYKRARSGNEKTPVQKFRQDSTDCVHNDHVYIA